MTTTRWITALGCLTLGLVGTCRQADATPPTVGITLSSSTLTFPSASPLTPSIAATQNPITVTVQMNNANNVSLTVIANGSLMGGGSPIAANNISWTATGTGFNGGTLSSSSQTTIGSGPTGTTGPLTVTGYLSFSFANRWTYNTGSYSQTITYTATAL